MTQYRIKTEAEFEKEFGANWRKIVRYHWADEMNHLFGRQLTDGEFKHIKNHGMVYIGIWKISEDMITEINYQPDKRIKANRHSDVTYLKAIKVEVSGRVTKVELDGKTATAICHPDDNFDYSLGLSVALARLARKLGEYETEETVVVRKKKNILDETKI